jgi:hypothetical protein
LTIAAARNLADALEGGQFDHRGAIDVYQTGLLYARRLRRVSSRNRQGQGWHPKCKKRREQ